MQLLDANIVSQYLPKRSRDAHKGDFGHVLVVGSDYGMAGAAIMTARAAARVGAGLVSVATRPEHVIVMNATQLEIMCRGIKILPDLFPLLNRATVIAIGPGLGQSTWSKELFHKAINCAQPKVLDADALNLLSQHPSRNEHWILTPHPGEAARLLNCTTQEIQHDRIMAVKKLQQKYGGVIVLKGAGTLIGCAEGEIALCNAGNPGMASGGMGDVLTGVIAGLLAQKLELKIAAQLGVWIHAHAADLAAAKGERGMLATDLLLYVQQVSNFDIRDEAAN